MLVRLIAIFAAFTVGAVASAAPADKITKESIESGGRSRTYYLYVPPVAGDQPKPLLVVLHGSGRRGNTAAEPWKDLARKEGIVLAAPDSLEPGGWGPVDGPDFVYDVVEAVKKAQRIDARRVYLFGFSAGAVFALDMGLLESRYFAAVAVHAGAFRDPSEFNMIANVQRKIPFAVTVGTNDRFFPLAAVRATRDAFVKAGLPFQVTEISGLEHAGYYTFAADINKKAWAFLSPTVLPEDPVYDRYKFQ